MSKLTKCFKMVIMLLFMLCMTGCGSGNNTDSDKIKIVCTTFSQYDWVREIAGDNIDNIELILLGNGGVDLHNYQPTADDIITISDCDVFIYVGGISDDWVNDVLKQATNEDMVVINMMDCVKSKSYLLEEEMMVEENLTGSEHEHSHEEEDESHEEHEEEVEYDEHIWLSLDNAQVICGYIRDALVKVDPENESRYNNNLENYARELSLLDDEYEDVVNNAGYNTVLFGDRFPFIYMMKDYGIEYYAAFSGCSSESEASFETVAFLAGKLDELELPAVLVVEGSTQNLANTIIDSTNKKDYQILVMDSLQTVSKEDLSNGITYLSVMENNLEVLKQALKCE